MNECFVYNLPKWSKTFPSHQLREIYYSSQTTNDQPHFNIQLLNTTYSHRSQFNNYYTNYYLLKRASTNIVMVVDQI